MPLENWPVDFTQEYLPLLQHFNYNKGALMQTMLENEIRYTKNSEICPLPPIKECAFLPYELDEIQTLFSTERGSPHRVSVLYHRCSAIMLKTQTHSSHVLGAKNSRNFRSSQVLCQRNESEDIGLAEVRFFARCNVRNDSGEQHTLWMAAVSWYMPHSCLVWYGIPAQVWATALYPGYCFISVARIRSRVVYTKDNVNFGRIIGLDTVYIIVPLDL